MRAFTPLDQKAVKTAADTLRANPKLDTVKVITELAVGEALVSFLEAKGTPAVVDRAWVLPPASRIGPLTPAERAAIIEKSVLKGHYEQTVDRESAYEKLKARTAEKTGNDHTTPPLPGPQTSAPAPTQSSTMSSQLNDLLFGTIGPRGGRHEGILGSAARSAARSVGSGVGREILRGVLGSILGGRRR